MQSISEDNLELQVDTAVLDEKRAILHASVIPPETGTRKPSTFVCAIDISGSMALEASLKRGDEVDMFTRLDLVKHSIKTIIQMLKPEDNLSLISFDNRVVVELPVAAMNQEGKDLAIGIIDSLEPMYSTNIWGALKSSIDEVMNSKNCKDTNNYILLFTDGEPNVNPPEGLMTALKNELNKIPKYYENFTIHTFGYGYSLDSKLLYDIAVLGNGIYNYIPESSMIGTSFVNFLSNALSTSVTNAKLTVTSEEGVELKSLGFEMVDSTIITGPIQFGQNKDFVLRYKIPSNTSSGFSLTLDYKGKKITKKVTNKSSKPNKDTGIQLVRSMFCRYLLKELECRVQHSKKKDKNYLSLIKKAIIESPFKNTEELKGLLKDFESTKESEGAISRAFADENSLHKWGFHYMRSLVRAHQLQTCHNFVDPGVQSYGGELFRDLQDEIDTIFCNIPAPKPAARKGIEEVKVQLPAKPKPEPAKKVEPKPEPVYRPPSPRYYEVNDYKSSNCGCFDGEGEVILENGKKKVKDLVKDDELICPGGKKAKVVALIVIKVKASIEVVELNGVKLTVKHPVKLNGEWKYPKSIKKPEVQYCDVVYNLILDKEHIVLINGLEVVTLGHGFKDNEVIEHSYFGSQNVIDDIKTFRGWDKGKVIIDEWKVIRDPLTHRVQGLSY